MKNFWFSRGKSWKETSFPFQELTLSLTPWLLMVCLCVLGAGKLHFSLFPPSQSFYFWMRQQQSLWAGGACLAWSLQPVWSCSGAPGWVFLRVIKAIWRVTGATEATPNCTRHSLDLESIVASFLTHFSQISLWKERMLLRHLPWPEPDVYRCVFSCTLISAGIQQCLHLLTSKLTPSCGHHPDSLITSRSLHGSVGRNGAAACCQHISSTNIVPVLLWRDGWQEKAQVLQVSPVATGLIGIYLHLGC